MVEQNIWTHKRTATIAIAAFLDCAIMATLIILLPGFIASLAIRILSFLTVAATLALASYDLGREQNPEHRLLLELAEYFERETGRPGNMLYAIIAGVAIAGIGIDILVALLLMPAIEGVFGSSTFILLPLALALALFPIAIWYKLLNGTLKMPRLSEHEFLTAIICLLLMAFGTSLAVQLPSSTPVKAIPIWGVSMGVGLAMVLALLILFARHVPPVEIHETIIVNTTLEDRCAAFIERYGLSSRESDVLLQLANGRSRPRIAEELCLSVATISTHVQKIYWKTGVHSSQELLDLLEATA